MSKASEVEPSEVFILTVDTVQNFDGTVVPFPETIGRWGNTAEQYATIKAKKHADEELRKRAKSLGANAVVGVRYSDGKYLGEKWWVYACGTPMYFDPPLSELYEAFKSIHAQEEDSDE